MSFSRPRTLLLLALAGAVLALVLARLLESSGQPGMPLPWTVVVVPVAAAAALLWFALPVRRWTRGERGAPLDPLRAARTVVLAKASALVASLFLGWYAGMAAWLLRPEVPRVQADRLAVAVAAAAGFVLMLVAGLVTERWCRRPPEDEDTDEE